MKPRKIVGGFIIIFPIFVFIYALWLTTDWKAAAAAFSVLALIAGCSILGFKLLIGDDDK